jgi:oligopeptide transport system ATP-binding protein
MTALLEASDLMKQYPIAAGGVVFKKHIMLNAVDGVTFSINKGECFGIAGESGSGKTTLAKLILLLEPISGGSMVFEGKDIRRLSPKDRVWYRRNVQAVFQDAGSSLNPRMSIASVVGEPIKVQSNKRPGKSAIRDRVETILKLVGLGPANLTKYPHELSGGQKQRVAIARAMIQEPALVVLDEPVSALDVSIQAQILNLLLDIQDMHHLTYLIIAHDLAMLQHVTDKIAVMYLGRVVEMGDTQEVFTNPVHPYTRALFDAVPQPIPGRIKTKPAIAGEIGNALHLPSGCRFHPRCAQATEACRREEAPLRHVTPSHLVACF